ncbi:DUF4190 domain-containing protein [Lysobacter pythonis]|uniref:DUF4190 domain-containing protein n=1 Tax=Solilutibacter pythonis TaxID=2483112 RepID=A0A3M2HXP0_9GAMM|nr:DUF4190 domain-containing protein [Lysobacter pythonis]RMH93025.1 DUF4190 domain-containing protein [Lysobacter pythonis]
MNAAPPQSPTPIRQNNPLAIVSLVSGILAWVLLPFIGSIVAVVTGYMARKEIRLAPERYDGDAMALIGLLLGWLQIVLTVIGVLFVIVIVLFFGGLAWFAAGGS